MGVRGTDCPSCVSAQGIKEEKMRIKFRTHFLPNSRQEHDVFYTDLNDLRHSGVKRDQLDVTCFIISLLNAQHVSDVNTSILRSLRLMC